MRHPPKRNPPRARQPTRASTRSTRKSCSTRSSRLRRVAVPNARSNATLGREREGSGVVIGDDGLVLTIGYLIVEADDVKITDAQGRTFPARGRRLRPRDGSGPGAQRRSDERGAGAARRFRPHVGARSRADRELGDGQRRVRVDRLETHVHRQLGIPARFRRCTRARR